MPCSCSPITLNLLHRCCPGAIFRAFFAVSGDGSAAPLRWPGKFEGLEAGPPGHAAASDAKPEEAFNLSRL
jgi:hypothetical protein